jgi:hypothetical protein
MGQVGREEKKEASNTFVLLWAAIRTHLLMIILISSNLQIPIDESVCACMPCCPLLGLE